MLNENQIYENKLRFMKLLSELNIDLTELSEYLDQVDYFNKPLSDKYSGAYL
jgi:hypothetical protein